ncbi:MAG: type IV pilus modification protein PilV [Propionivibrio sp.]
MRKKTHFSNRAQYGSVLLEALIAVLIFSFGILALVSMQTAAARSTIDAKYRADAAFLANQLVGLLWVEGQASRGAYVNGLDATQAGAGGCAAGGAAASAPEALAWLGQVARLLPEAQAARQQITIANNNVTVRVCWQDRSDNAGGAYHNHVVSAQINRNE